MTTATPKPALTFHVGHHKTGSTSIQEALATGRLRLEGQKILYPTRLDHNYLPTHFDAFLDADRLIQGDPGRPGLKGIARRLAAGGFDHAVISGENFENYDPARLRKVLEEFFLPHVGAHRVVCYVRPHAQRLMSSYAEQVKIGLFSGTPEELQARMMRSSRLIYAPAMAAWSASFGDHFIARPMVRDLMEGGSVVRDFAHQAFGAGAPVVLDDSGSSNESLCLEDLLLVGYVQAQFADLSKHTRLVMGWALALAFNAHRREGTKTQLKLYRSLAEDLHKAYAEDARALDAGIFAGTPVMMRDLEKAVDTALPRAQSRVIGDYYSADELRQISVMAGLVARLAKVDENAARAVLTAQRLAALGIEMPVAPAKSGPKAGKAKAGAGQKNPGQKNPGKKKPGKMRRAKKAGA